MFNVSCGAAHTLELVGVTFQWIDIALVHDSYLFFLIPQTITSPIKQNAPTSHHI